MVAASCPPRSESAVVVVDRIERALSHAVEAASENAPPRLREALAYAVFPGGARLRPRLCLAVAAALGAGPAASSGPAAAVELLHCASLVHDDLPCFDDAALRRGRASVHAAYGEAMAVLVGDALIAAASTTLAISMASSPALPSAMRALGDAACSLVAGQAWELEPAGPPALDVYHRAKTGSLFEVSAALGAMVASRPAAPYRRFGSVLGLAFQIADDLGDAFSRVETLGKPVGRDAALGRPTAASDGREHARRRLVEALAAARASVPADPGAPMLHAFLEDLERTVASRLGIS